MKFWLAIAVTISFLGVAAFGIFAMNHGGGHSQGCIAATAQETDCPRGENILSFLTFHLNAFRNFSTAVFGENLASLLVLLFSLPLVFGAAIIQNLRFNYPPRGFPFARQFSEPPSLSLQRQLVRWLALHENSPAIS